MKRNQIDSAYTWDLSSMFASQEAFNTCYQECESLVNALTKQKGHIADTKESFCDFFDQQEELSRKLNNLISYARMYTDVDPDEETAQQNLSKAYVLYQKTVVALNFVDLEVMKEKESIEKYLAEDACNAYRYPMQEIFRRMPHQLDEEKEVMMAQMQDILRVPESTYESFRLEFEPVMVDGKPVFLNGGNYHQFLLNPDEKVRKEAFEHYFQEYKRYQNVFLNLLSGHIKGKAFEARLRNFPSTLEASLFEDGVEKALFDLVVRMGNETYRPYAHEYFKLRKEILGLQQQHVYDIALPLVKSVDITYTVDDCFAILKKALAPLGEDYIAMLDVAREERWIDFMPHEKKRSGAYSAGTYDSKPFILTNFTGEYDSLSTLAHEFGHSMHSYYSHKHNRAMLAEYRIFVAEVASTVNELLLNDYLLKHSDNNDHKAYLLSNLLNQMIGTMYRQTMYATFEYQLYEAIEKGEALSSKDVCDLYEQLNKDYFGDSVIVDDLQRYGCYHVPHFYYNFYVYKYTLGMSVAISFAKKILNGEVDAYREFLTKGGSEAPLDELMHAGVDPRQTQVYEDAFGYFKEILDQFRSCGTHETSQKR